VNANCVAAVANDDDHGDVGASRVAVLWPVKKLPVNAHRVADDLQARALEDQAGLPGS